MPIAIDADATTFELSEHGHNKHSDAAADVACRRSAPFTYSVRFSLMLAVSMSFKVPSMPNSVLS